MVLRCISTFYFRFLSVAMAAQQRTIAAFKQSAYYQKNKEKLPTKWKADCLLSQEPQGSRNLNDGVQNEIAVFVLEEKNIIPLLPNLWLEDTHASVLNQGMDQMLRVIETEKSSRLRKAP